MGSQRSVSTSERARGEGIGGALLQALIESSETPGIWTLQAGIFTRDLYRMQQAWDTLEVGGVIIGDVPSWRTDQMPYGGVKDSGLGREGLRFAIEDMSEIRLLAIRTP